MSVRRALIPCGGKGTRMLALTGGGPKELMLVGGESALSRVARECVSSGITDLLVVIAPGKDAIVEHLARLDDLLIDVRISFVDQPRPRGLADAIRLGRDFASGEALGVALPDNLFLAERPALAQVIEQYEATGRNVVAVTEIGAHEAARRGPTSIYSGTLVNDSFEIERIPDKRERTSRFDTGGAPSAFTGVGRYVLDDQAFDAIDQVERALTPGAELDDVPVLQRLLAAGRLTGRRIRGRFFDLGVPDGHAEADRALGSSWGRTSA